MTFDPQPYPTLQPSRGLEGERRVVTILFCDVKGSTAMAEHLDPEEWAEIMNAAFTYLIQPVQRYEGTVARLMGDSILAFFGAPIAHEDDPQRAVLAGLDIVDGIRPYCEQLRREVGLDFNVRVGINTGVVVVGEVGTALAGEYTAMGDAVNLAARMEQTAQPGSVQISGETHRLVSAFFEVEALGEVEVKGKREGVPAYRVLKRKEHPERGRGIVGFESPLVGREREVQTLRQALDDLKSGRGQILTLIGEAGLGKSRLIDELRANSNGDSAQQIESLNHTHPTPTPAVHWVESRGISYEASRPYGLFTQHLRHICEVKESDPPDAVRAKIASAMTGLDPDTRAAVSRIAELLLVKRAVPDGSAAPLEGEALKREIFASSLAMWRSFAGLVPQVLVFDDLHWADPASVELLLHLFQLADQVPILFLCAFRPHRSSPAWGVKTSAETNYPHRYSEISLSPLSISESGTLVDNLLTISDLPEELRQLVLRKSEGNPFFLEEVVRVLVDHGVVQRDESGLRWKAAASYEEIEIPDNLQALLLARIDRLEKDTRRTLQLASVIGRSFYHRVLQAIVAAVSDLDQQLVTLQRVELIRELGRRPELEYIFRHELTRDAAYKSILRRQRRQFHRAVGEAIEQLFPDRLEEEAHLLAYHFAEAGDLGRGLRYYTLAGDKAAGLFANTEASQHYRHALQIATKSETSSKQLIYLYTRLGRTLELMGHQAEALGNYQELQALGQACGLRALELAALIPQVTIYSTFTSEHDPQKGRALSLEALGVARELGDPRAEARSLWNLMLIENYTSSDVTLAITYGEQALGIARLHGLREELAYIVHDLSRAYFRAGRMDEAWTAENEAIQHWRETNNLPMLADALANLGEAYYLMSEFGKSLEYLEEGLRISRGIDNAWGQAYTLFGMVPVYLERGDVDRSLAAMHESQALATQAKFSIPLLVLHLIGTWLYVTLGDRGSAADLWSGFPDLSQHINLFMADAGLWRSFQLFQAGEPQEANTMLKQMGDQLLSGMAEFYYGPFLYAHVVQVAVASGHHERALAEAERYLQRMAATGTRVFLPDLLHSKGRALQGLGRVEEAHQALLEALAIARQQTSRRSLWLILYDLAQLVSTSQKFAPGASGSGENLQEINPQAEAYLKEAREVVEYIAAHISDEQLRTSFLTLPEVLGIIS